MTLKNIEVFIDATPEGEKRTDYAATLAQQCGAHLAGIHVISASRPVHRTDYFAVGEKAIRSSLAWQEAADEAVTTTVRQRFEAISAKRDISAEFRMIRRGGPNEDLILCSLHSDLVVIGQRELHDLPATRLLKGSCSRAELRFWLYRAPGNPSRSARRYSSVGTPVVRLGARSQMRCPSSSRLRP
jgi:nucleotide-binding universal stress UspA family protein